jgi:hypothetical protein
MYDELTANKGADTGIIPLTNGEKKRMLKCALESSVVMKKLTTDKNVQKAFGHGTWAYSIYHNLVMTTAIEDDHTTKQADKIKCTVKAVHGTSPGRGRGGKDNKSGRGKGRGKDKSKQKDEKDTRADAGTVPPEILAQLPAKAQKVIAANNRVETKIDKSLGFINIPSPIYHKLPLTAQKSINFHNHPFKRDRASNTAQVSPVENTHRSVHSTQIQSSSPTKVFVVLV